MKLVHPDKLPCENEDVVIAAHDGINIKNSAFKQWACEIISGSGEITESDIDFVDAESLGKFIGRKTDFEDADTFNKKTHAGPGVGIFVETEGTEYNKHFFIQHWSDDTVD